MSVTDGFRDFALEQLQRAASDIRSRGMFGGVGIYAGDVFFGLIDDDVLYLKVDDSNRARFEARGLGSFRPSGQGGEMMQYYEVPPEVLEDVEALSEWVGASVDVARRAKRKRSTRPGR